MSEKHIAKITRTFLGVEHHGIFTASITVDYGGTVQVIGGFGLDEPIYDDDRFVERRGTAYGLEWVRRFMLAAGVDQWEKLVGRTIYVVKDGGSFSRVAGIEPLPTEPGKPFMFADIVEMALSGRSPA